MHKKYFDKEDFIDDFIEEFEKDVKTQSNL